MKSIMEEDSNDVVGGKDVENFVESVEIIFMTLENHSTSNTPAKSFVRDCLFAMKVDSRGVLNVPILEGDIILQLSRISGAYQELIEKKIRVKIFKKHCYFLG